MGCTGSDVHTAQSTTLLENKKPSVWLIGGGPGCQKGKICDYLIRDYKFKYLSSYDMVQFEQERGGPDAELIMKLFKQKKTMPSDLIVRLVKKAIASCGVRRFLIDGFPNSVEDVNQFDRELTSKEIDFYGYLHIEISEKKMIQSGIQANSNDKSKSKEEIEKNVKDIVTVYLTQSEKIKKEYIAKNKFRLISGEQGADKAYQDIKDYLDGLKILPPPAVKVFFSHFDSQAHEALLCDDLVRKYGLYFYTPKALIQQASTKLNSPQGEAIKRFSRQSKQVPTSLVLSLMRKKIEKHDYRGGFLISGYPRTIEDAQEWDKFFGWQTDILGYLTFEIPDQKFKKIFTEKALKYKPTQKTEEIEKEYNQYQQKQKQISQYYKQRQKLLIINAEDQKKAMSDIHKFFEEKRFKGRNKLNTKKIVFVNTLCGNGDVVVQAAKKKGASIINMQTLMQQKIKQNGLYSQLIESFIRIGKPVSGIVSSRILFQRICSDPANLILVVGFPNSEDQLQCWQEQVGQSLDLCLIITHSQNHKYIQQNLKDRIKNKKVTASEKDVLELTKQNSNKMSARLKSSDWKCYIVNSLDDVNGVDQALNSANFK